MTNTITIDSNLYKGAFLYAEKHNLSIQEMVSQYLSTFKVEDVKRTEGRKELPLGVKKLRGALKNVADKDDLFL